MIFNFRLYLQEKLTAKFPKYAKKFFFRPSGPIWGQSIRISAIEPIFLKKLMSGFQVTMVSDGCTHTQTDKHEFIRPFRLKPGFQKKKIK